jgi:serine/threonine protein kinase
MEIYCTRPGCPRPLNRFADLDDRTTLKTAQQKYCTSCGMPLILVGRYIPSRLLGKGGFGTAFLARDRYTPAMRQCVVKQFQPSSNLNPQQLRTAQDLFEREAEVLEELGSRHPQIPDLFAFFPLSTPSQQPGKEDQFFYLVQEFIDGQNLEEELEAKGSFSEAQALEVLQEILRVLEFVHEHGSIHRDIKPSNIMRDKNGRLYLLDFGAVKQIRAVAAAGAAAGRSTGIYSMGFAPPEQMTGSQVYPSTDLYALAVTVITLLTGKDPSELYDSFNNDWNWRRYAPQVSDTLASVLNRMLLPSPNQRFQSAQEVIDALAPRPTPAPQPISPPSPPPHSPTARSSTALGSPSPSPASPPVRSTRFARQPFSLLEMLSGAAFTGFEGALLFIALSSLLPSPGISIGVWGMMMGGLIFAEFRRVIEKFDFLIIAGITLCAMFFVPALQAGIPLGTAVIVAALAGAAAIAVTALFRLVYLLLSRLLG